MNVSEANATVQLLRGEANDADRQLLADKAGKALQLSPLGILADAAARRHPAGRNYCRTHGVGRDECGCGRQCACGETFATLDAFRSHVTCDEGREPWGPPGWTPESARKRCVCSNQFYDCDSSLCALNQPIGDFGSDLGRPVANQQIVGERRCTFCQLTEDDLGDTLAECDEHGYCCDACHDSGQVYPTAAQLVDAPNQQVSGGDSE